MRTVSGVTVSCDVPARTPAGAAAAPGCCSDQLGDSAAFFLRQPEKASTPRSIKESKGRIPKVKSPLTTRSTDKWPLPYTHLTAKSFDQHSPSPLCALCDGDLCG